MRKGRLVLHLTNNILHIITFCTTTTIATNVTLGEELCFSRFETPGFGECPVMGYLHRRDTHVDHAEK